MGKHEKRYMHSAEKKSGSGDNMEHERIICILEYLNRHTNDSRGVTIKDIQRYLAENANMQNVTPITIRRDIERIERSGYEIEVTAGAHNTAYYRLISKGFTFNEIRFIVDSLSINKFLSNIQKQRLIKKFEGLCSEQEVRQLISRISLNGQGNPSLNLLENLDRVHKIISEKKKINFEYGKYDVHRNINYYSKRREMIPCKVVYFNERFYLKCIDEQTLEHRTYRIDRMRRITAGDKTKVKAELPKYDGVVVDIFDPECFELVTLRVKRHLLDDMLEQFGNYGSPRDDSENPDCVVLNVKIGISSGFYRWIMRYGEDIEILSPLSVRQAFFEKLKRVYGLYEE